MLTQNNTIYHICSLTLFTVQTSVLSHLYVESHVAGAAVGAPAAGAGGAAGTGGAWFAPLLFGTAPPNIRAGSHDCVSRNCVSRSGDPVRHEEGPTCPPRRKDMPLVRLAAQQGPLAQRLRQFYGKNVGPRVAAATSRGCGGRRAVD